MDNVVQIFAIVSGIAAALAVIISIALYLHGLRREKQLVTLTHLVEIRRRYQNALSMDYDEKMTYLNELEYFSTGVNVKIYNIKVVNKMCGSVLIYHYDDWASTAIKVRRKDTGNDKAYSEFEKLITKLKKKRTTEISHQMH